jgi:non-specific protein-tyrosine kinase
MTPDPSERTDPRALLSTLWRWKLLFVAVLVVAPVAAYLIESRKPKEYQSSTLVTIQASTVDTSAIGSASGSFSTSNIFAIARLVTTSRVAAIAASLLHPPADPGSIAGEVSADGDQTTGFLTITAQDSNPRRAAAIANAFAAALSTNRAAVALGEINHSIAALQQQLQLVPPGPANQTARQQLQQQLAQLRALRAAQGNNAAVVQPASASSSPVSPHVRRAVELGLVIGLLLAIGAVAFAENGDRRIRNPTELEELTKLPLLSAVPAKAFGEQVDVIDRAEEAFQMLRAAITYFNVDRRLTTLVITSPGEKEGKTMVAVRLAIAAARAGKRVTLVDADLRRSGVSARLELKPAAGLGAVLAGEATLAQVLVDHPLSLSRAGGSLTVLPSGPPPPNPSELLGSNEMRRVLSQLEAQSELIVVDTPAALAVSDPLALLPEASGIVLVARMDQTRREAIRRLQRIIATADGTLLGVVATGSTRGPGYESYSYGYAPAPNGHGESSDAGRAAGGLRERLWAAERRGQSGLAVEPPESDAT